MKKALRTLFGRLSLVDKVIEISNLELAKDFKIVVDFLIAD